MREVAEVACETQVDDDGGESVTFPANSSTAGEAVVPGEIDTSTVKEDASKVKCKTRVRHHTLRLGLTAARYARLGKPRPPFEMTIDALGRWKDKEQQSRVFRCGKVHRPGRGEHGGRSARVAQGPDDLRCRGKPQPTALV